MQRAVCARECLCVCAAHVWVRRRGGVRVAISSTELWTSCNYEFRKPRIFLLQAMEQYTCFGALVRTRQSESSNLFIQTYFYKYQCLYYVILTFLY